MKRFTRILSSLLLAGGLAFGAAPASMAHDRDAGPSKQCSGKPGHHGKRGHHLGYGAGDFDHKPPFLRGISLTEEQRDRIFEITYAQIPSQRAFHKEMRKLHRQMQALPLSSDYDAGKMRQLVDAEAKLKADHLLKVAEAHNQIYKLLTDQQRKELASRKDKDKKKPA